MPDPDRVCLHENFEVHADIQRITHEEGGPVHGFLAELHVSCADCGERFRWVGLPAGLAWNRPMVSPDEFEMRAPIRPASADADFGTGIPGFAVRFKEVS